MQKQISQTQATRFSRRRLWVLITAVVVAGTGAWAWLAHPSVLGGGGETGMQLTAGQTAYLDTAIYPNTPPGDPVNITISALKPRVLIDTSDAEIEFLICTPVPEEARIGAVTGPIADYCTASTAWQPGRYTMHDRLAPYLITAVTPTEDGVIVIDGVDITYRHGIKYGTQHTGATIIVTASSEE